MYIYADKVLKKTRHAEVLHAKRACDYDIAFQGDRPELTKSSFTKSRVYSLSIFEAI